jgi:hypothetical protein
MEPPKQAGVEEPFGKQVWGQNFSVRDYTIICTWARWLQSRKRLTWWMCIDFEMGDSVIPCNPSEEWPITACHFSSCDGSWYSPSGHTIHPHIDPPSLVIPSSQAHAVLQVLIHPLVAMWSWIWMRLINVQNAQSEVWLTILRAALPSIAKDPNWPGDMVTCSAVGCRSQMSLSIAVQLAHCQGI